MFSTALSCFYAGTAVNWFEKKVNQFKVAPISYQTRAVQSRPRCMLFYAIKSMSLISLFFTFFGIGYVWYSTLGFFEDKPTDRLYNRLLSGKLYYQHLIVASILLVAGFYRVSKGHYGDVWAMSPFLFLILLRPINLLVKTLTGRNIFVYTRWDKRPDDYRFIIDGVLGILLITIPIITPGYIMNKLNTGQFII